MDTADLKPTNAGSPGVKILNGGINGLLPNLFLSNIVDIAEPFMLSMSTERDERINSFNKKFDKYLDNYQKQQDSELEQRYSREFINHMERAEERARNGAFIGAMEHNSYAEMINEFLKQWK